MKSKKIIYIHHACVYTREGINFILKELSGDLNVKLISNAGYVQANTIHDSKKEDVDFFILGLEWGNNYGETFDFFIQWLPLYYPQAKIIVMTQCDSIGMLKNYLLGLGNVSAVLDSKIEIQELRQSLQAILTGSLDSKAKRKQTMLLTNQEVKVLKHLLQGMPVFKVARKLQIHCKTVSSHKRAALNKLEVTSLYALMKYGNNTHMVSGLLRREGSTTTESG
ncbi:helix-turn-helix transcriptional regulator [Yersinia ruckeri]|uniref:helix-turn-helix transcriptional regulator n=1 Tax=Yersinia ruckeri TaxID=29486 RepID=UPI0020C0ACD8|nr:LuxR C-terminal-related transcriptional regulator [Yersinia ruckeri]MCK8564506.1 LuxR C-terminal-related transcriptional regulator [Yersinia ruckeri]UZY19794.1 LuxR C-terminal-related transcriptional regulator [Yersinia ruckeri]